jgi:hypothetical protein
MILHTKLTIMRLDALLYALGGFETGEAGYGNKRGWSAADDVMLRRLWPTHTHIKVVARLLDRTHCAVYERAHRLGLKDRLNRPVWPTAA